MTSAKYRPRRRNRGQEEARIAAVIPTWRAMVELDFEAAEREIERAMRQVEKEIARAQRQAERAAERASSVACPGRSVHRM